MFSTVSLWSIILSWIVFEDYALLLHSTVRHVRIIFNVLQVKEPSGEQIYDTRDKTEEMYNFIAYHEGVYKFCFTNKAPFHETIDFDVHASHIYVHDEHAKDGTPALLYRIIYYCVLYLLLT